VIRDDLSDRLIHLTRGTHEEAGVRLATILSEGRLLGSNTDIRGGHHCVCFTEAPVGQLSRILAMPGVHNMRYMPYDLDVP
jgi:hypothetical protein